MRWQPRCHPTRLYRRKKIKGRSGPQKDPLARPTSQAMLDFWELDSLLLSIEPYPSPPLIPNCTFGTSPNQDGAGPNGRMAGCENHTDRSDLNAKDRPQFVSNVEAILAVVLKRDATLTDRERSLMITEHIRPAGASFPRAPNGRILVDMHHAQFAAHVAKPVGLKAPH